MRPLRARLLPLLAAVATAALAWSAGASVYSAQITLWGDGTGVAWDGSTLYPMTDVHIPQATYTTDLAPHSVPRSPRSSTPPWAPERRAGSTRAGSRATKRRSGRAQFTCFRAASRAPRRRSGSSIPRSARPCKAFLQTSFTDAFVMTLEGQPSGTPFLMSIPVQLDAVFGSGFARAQIA